MLVTCPECGAKISSESEECKKCGLPHAAQFSKENCEHLRKEITSLNVPFLLHLSEGCTKIFLSEITADKSFNEGLDIVDSISFQREVAKGSRGKWFEIADDFNVGRREKGTGYQLECLLRCLLCGEIIQSHFYYGKLI